MFPSLAELDSEIQDLDCCSAYIAFQPRPHVDHKVFLLWGSIYKRVGAGQVEQAKQRCISRVPHLLLGLQSRRAALHLLKLHSNLIPSKSQG